ncbi:MAG: protein-disulfide reductase DsbD family protein [Alphaproteobacteria bacterium]
MRALLTLLITLLTLALAGQPSYAQSSTQLEITKASLVSDTLYIQGGQPFRLGVLLEPKKGWHSYWENPGDAGLASELAWTLPEGFEASGIRWPAPERINEGPLTIYGYHDTVFLPVTVTPPATLDASQVYKVVVKASWLICLDICIPESAELELTLPVGEPSLTMHAGHFIEAEEQAPRLIEKPFMYQHEGSRMTLTVPLDSVAMETISKAEFFIRQMNVVRYPADPVLSIRDGIAHITLEATNTPPEQFSGLLQLKDGTATRVFDVRFERTASALPVTEPATQQQQGGTPFLPVILLAALLGGMILNLMPCVLPVLSLKALTIVKKGTSEPAAARAHGIAYTLGILLSFAVLAGILIVLQHTGEAVGWGYQMQSPVFVGVLVYLLFLVGLNLSGLFDLPVLLGNTGRTLTSESSPRGSFFTGMLATAVATPCTAPFMASAVGIALTLPAWQSMLVFEALGLGLALPFLLVSFFPVLLRFLPKPGAWMETFRQFLAFPMYASVIWLLWVLTLQVGAEGVMLALSGMLMIVVIIWMRRLFDKPIHYRITAAIMAAMTILCTLQMLGNAEMNSPMETLPSDYSDVATQPYSKESLAALRAQGKAVFVDATAAWCITCQVNAKTAIQTDAVMQAFKDHNITLMIADWTKRNMEIREFLSSFGYQGVPLYVYYPPDGGTPKVLPQVLTPDIILSTINPNGE